MPYRRRDLLEVVLFPKARRFHGRKISALGPYIFEGELRRERRSAHLDVRDVVAVAPRRGPEGAALIAAGTVIDGGSGEGHGHDGGPGAGHGY